MTVNVRNVSAVLKRAGRQPVNAQTKTPRTGGYRATQMGDRVHVSYRFGQDSDSMTWSEASQMQKQAHDDYAVILEQAGYTLRSRESGHGVFVTGGKVASSARPGSLTVLMKDAIRSGRNDVSIECGDKTYDALVRRGLVNSHVGNLTQRGLVVLAQLDAQAAREVEEAVAVGVAQNEKRAAEPQAPEPEPEQDTIRYQVQYRYKDTTATWNQWSRPFPGAQAKADALRFARDSGAGRSGLEFRVIEIHETWTVVE